MKEKLKVLGVMLCISVLSVDVSAQTTSGIRSDFDTPAFQKQLGAKQLYREAWNKDNETPLSTVEQLEYLQQHNPGFDADTLAVMRRGTGFLKKMDFGLKDSDMEQDAAAIRQNPSEALTQMSDKIKTTATAKDALEATDLIEPSKRLMNTMYQDHSIEPDTYQFNIEDF